MVELMGIKMGVLMEVLMVSEWVQRKERATVARSGLQSALVKGH